MFDYRRENLQKNCRVCRPAPWQTRGSWELLTRGWSDCKQLATPALLCNCRQKRACKYIFAASTTSLFTEEGKKTLKNKQTRGNNFQPSAAVDRLGFHISLLRHEWLAWRQRLYNHFLQHIINFNGIWSTNIRTWYLTGKSANTTRPKEFCRLYCISMTIHPSTTKCDHLLPSMIIYILVSIRTLSH